MAGVLLAISAAGAMVLLAFHPAEGGGTFAQLLQSEAANRAQSAAVHGGFAALLVVELMALAILSLFARRPPSTAGTVLFGLGVVALSASLITDGLVIPAIAAKYAALPDKIDFARSLFVLCSAYIAVLMPAGLMLLGAGVAFWGIGLAHEAPSRLNGVIGILSGFGAAISVGVLGLQPFAVMGGIVGVNSWLLFLGITAARGKLRG